MRVETDVGTWISEDDNIPAHHAVEVIHSTPKAGDVHVPGCGGRPETEVMVYLARMGNHRWSLPH